MNIEDISKVSFKLKLSQLISLALAIATAVGAWYVLQADIQKGMVYPKAGTGMYQVDYNDMNAGKTWPPTRSEYEFKYNALLDKVLELEKEIEALKNEN